MDWQGWGAVGALAASPVVGLVINKVFGDRQAVGVREAGYMDRIEKKLALVEAEADDLEADNRVLWDALRETRQCATEGKPLPPLPDLRKAASP